MKLSRPTRKILGFFVILVGFVMVVFGFVRGQHGFTVIGVFIMLLGIYFRPNRKRFPYK